MAARIRTLKPEFFKDDDLAGLPPVARLLFQGLWCLADREGRLEDRPRRIKVEILPYDDVDCEELLQQLEAKGFIERYVANDRACIYIPNFLRHQIPTREEPQSDLPTPEGIVIEYIRPPNDTVRHRLYTRDNFTCAYCDLDMRDKSRSRCLDHVIPYSKGGSHHEDNLVTSCKRCNDIKRARTPSEAGFKWPKGMGSYVDLRPLTEDERIANGTVDPPVNTPLTGCDDKPDREREGDRGKERDKEGTPLPPEGEKGLEKSSNLGDYLPAEFQTIALSETWEKFKGYRREKKQKLYTATGCEQLAGLMVNAGLEPADVPKVISECMASGWAGIPAGYIQKFKADRGRAPNRNGNSRNETIQEKTTDTMNAIYGTG